MTSIINYCLNKFCPYLIILFLLLYNSNIELYKCGLIIGACIFLDKFSFRAGYSLAFCEKHNIKLDDQDRL